MIALVIIFAAVTFASLVAAGASMHRCMILTEQHDELAERVDASLDTLDECFKGISKAAQIPVMSDEPVVKTLVTDIKRARDAIMVIASSIASFEEEQQD